MENMNDVLINFIVEDGLILIPVLYILGEIIKNALVIKDKWIPLILLVVSILFSIFLLNESIINNIIQGILITGATVYIDQVKKQYFEKEY